LRESIVKEGINFAANSSHYSTNLAKNLALVVNNNNNFSEVASNAQLANHRLMSAQETKRPDKITLQEIQ
jgi:hypothetical protein